VSAFGTFSLADIATQAQNGQLRSMQIDALRRKQETDAEEAERTAMREQAGMIAKLTDGVQDEASYQQRRQAALAYGMDPRLTIRSSCRLTTCWRTPCSSLTVRRS
jgi:hypothetical protein